MYRVHRNRNHQDDTPDPELADYLKRNYYKPPTLIGNADFNDDKEVKDESKGNNQNDNRFA